MAAGQHGAEAGTGDVGFPRGGPVPVGTTVLRSIDQSLLDGGEQSGMLPLPPFIEFRHLVDLEPGQKRVYLEG